jgi:hypothetical protein
LARERKFRFLERGRPSAVRAKRDPAEKCENSLEKRQMLDGLDFHTQGSRGGNLGLEVATA